MTRRNASVAWFRSQRKGDENAQVQSVGHISSYVLMLTFELTDSGKALVEREVCPVLCQNFCNSNGDSSDSSNNWKYGYVQSECMNCIQ